MSAGLPIDFFVRLTFSDFIGLALVSPEAAFAPPRPPLLARGFLGFKPNVSKADWPRQLRFGRPESVGVEGVSTLLG